MKTVRTIALTVAIAATVIGLILHAYAEGGMPLAVGIGGAMLIWGIVMSGKA